MSSLQQSANNDPLVSRSAAGSEVCDALRLFVGRGRRYSVKQLSNATGVKDRVIECAMTDPESTDWRPLPIEALASIGKFLGPDFNNEWMPRLMGQGAFWLPEPGETSSVRELGASGVDDAATINRATIDDEVTRDETPDVLPAAKRQMARSAQIIAIAERAAA